MYLLSTPALLDVVTGSHPTAQPWVQTVRHRDIHLCTISVGRARYEITLRAPSAMRMTMHGNLSALVAAVRAYGNILAVDERMADEWARLLRLPLTVNQPNGQPADLDDDNRIVVACAVQFRLQLVEEAQPYHSQVPGLTVQTY